MTGIVLCEISSGLVIEPEQIPEGVVGSDTPVTFVATGAVGTVTWSMAPPNQAVSTNAYSGRTLVDNGDGTAALTGTFTSASYRGFKSRSTVYCWDSANQLAATDSLAKVVYPEPMRIDGPTFSGGHMQIAGGPGPHPTGLPGGYSWEFNPPLPTGWSFTQNEGEIDVIIGSGIYKGTVTVSIQIGLEIPEEYISASKTISIIGTA